LANLEKLSKQKFFLILAKMFEDQTGESGPRAIL
jgi:hypothetical protein